MTHKVITLFLSLLLPTVVLAKANDCPEPDDQHKYLDAPIDFKDPSKGTFKFHYKLQNGLSSEKTTLVMLHGGPGGNLKDWDHCPSGFCLNQLSDNYNIVTVDERGGSGCSLLPKEANKEHMTILATAEDIEALRKHLVGEEGKIVVYGQSFGTIVGTVYTANHDDKVEKLILDGSVYDYNNTLNPGFDKAVEKVMAENDQFRKDYTEVVKKITDKKFEMSIEEFMYVRNMLTYSYANLTQILPAMVHQMNQGVFIFWALITYQLNQSLGGLAASPAQKYIACLELFDVNFPAGEIREGYMATCQGHFGDNFVEMNKRFKKYTAADFTSKIKTPVLLLVGEFDTPTPSGQTVSLDKELKNSISYIIPKTGHSLLMEKEKCETELIQSFLSNGITEDLESIFNQDFCQE